jgi:hypothetical protein
MMKTLFAHCKWSKGTGGGVKAKGMFDDETAAAPVTPAVPKPAAVLKAPSTNTSLFGDEDLFGSIAVRTRPTSPFNLGWQLVPHKAPVKVGPTPTPSAGAPPKKTVSLFGDDDMFGKWAKLFCFVDCPMCALWSHQRAH